MRPSNLVAALILAAIGFGGDYVFGDIALPLYAIEENIPYGHYFSSAIFSYLDFMFHYCDPLFTGLANLVLFFGVFILSASLTSLAGSVMWFVFIITGGTFASEHDEISGGLERFGALAPFVIWGGTLLNFTFVFIFFYLVWLHLSTFISFLFVL